MLMNFWYAVAFTTEVADKPVRIRALGQDLVLYRKQNGEIVCMSDLCVHRGGALSLGWTKGDCLVCPYHGWEYEPEGACVTIPANLNATIPKKARVDAYPAAEKYAWIWVFLGDIPESERPPIPELPGFDDPKQRLTTGQFSWKANYERVLENSMDIAHAPFVHSGSFGNKEKPKVEDYEVVSGPFSGEATVTLDPPPAKGIWKYLYSSKKERPGVMTTTGFFMPNVTKLVVRLPLGTLVIYNANVPIDEYTTVTKWASLRTFFIGSWADANSIKRTMKIFYEDQPIVEGQRPELVPFDLSAELHVKSDALQLAYRRMRQRFLDQGWGIDQHRITVSEERQYTVIPSPARREVPELQNAWVMREVPVGLGKAPPPELSTAEPLGKQDVDSLEGLGVGGGE
jgi:phenylpropionate dioxygenase-like ring-hydroxylating dioxygenase large terminal subunit